MSSQHPIGTESSRSYAAAYALHYSQRDLLGALTAYDHLIERHPTSPEADYSRSQMHNIVRSVIPASQLLASQVELARRALQEVDAPLAGDDPSRPKE
jgi:hypothetical protein